MICCCKGGYAENGGILEVTDSTSIQPDEFKWTGGLEDGDPGKRQKSKVIVQFELPSGNLESVAFTRRPLGLDFHRKIPLTVKRAKQGFHAKDDHNIQKNWIVKQVEGSPLECMSFCTDFQTLHMALQVLPEAN